MGHFTVTKRSKELCIGHRLIDYSGQCKNVHGHGIVIEVVLTANQNDVTGLTVDFDHVKLVLQTIDTLWDHAFLYNTNDNEMAEFLEDQDSKRYEFSKNPTMETIAEEAWSLVTRGLTPSEAYHVLAVRVFEKGGNDNVAEYRG